MQQAKITLCPTGFDSRLCQDNNRIDPESFPGLLGQGKILGDKILFGHDSRGLFDFRSVAATFSVLFFRVGEWVETVVTGFGDQLA